MVLQPETPHRFVRVISPEGRQIFPTLSVEENLIATAATRGRALKWRLKSVYAPFPRLAEWRRRFGDQLSGGEQRMLAIGRALMTNPKLLVLDEATEGLAPLIRAEIWSSLTKLEADGQAILVVDKNLGALRRLVDRFFVLETGRVVWNGASAEAVCAAGSDSTSSSRRRRRAGADCRVTQGSASCTS